MEPLRILAVAAQCREAIHLLDLAKSSGHQDELDMVLLDVVMPGLGGIRTLAAIQTLAPGLPIVLMSGFAADGEVEKALADGARAFLSKPFTLQDLTRTLDDCLSQ